MGSAHSKLEQGVDGYPRLVFEILERIGVIEKLRQRIKKLRPKSAHKAEILLSLLSKNLWHKNDYVKKHRDPQLFGFYLYDLYHFVAYTVGGLVTKPREYIHFKNYLKSIKVPSCLVCKRAKKAK